MTKKFIFLVCMVIGQMLSIQTISAQVFLEDFDCFSLKATIDNNQNTKLRLSKNLTYSLEKLIAPSVWSERVKKKGHQRNVTFENLSAGFYRVSYFLEREHHSHNHNHSHDQQTSFVSNVVEIKNCEDLEQSLPVVNSNYFDVQIYPNPAKDEVYFQLPTTVTGGNGVIQIQDLTGKLVKQIKISSSIEMVSLSDALSGVYFVTIKNGNDIVTHKKLIVAKN